MLNVLNLTVHICNQFVTIIVLHSHFLPPIKKLRKSFTEFVIIAKNKEL